MLLKPIGTWDFEFVYPGYWNFENGVTRVSEDVLLDPDGQPLVSAPVPWIGDWGPGLDN